MALARFDNILAIKTDSGRVVGFHAHNLQVATLDPQVWKALTNPGDAAADVKREILEWNGEVDAEVTDAQPKAGEFRSLVLNVSQICNMRCSYCAAGGDGTWGSKTKHIDIERTKKQIAMLLERLPEGGEFSISFMGGEPLVYPNSIREIASHTRELASLKKVRAVFDINTNATLVTDEITDMLASFNFLVKVSIDGPPDLNDKQRKLVSGKGSTELVLKGIERLVAVKPRLRALAATSVLGAHNTDAVATWKFLMGYDFDFIRFEYAAGSEDEIHSPRYAESLSDVARLAWEKGGERELRRIDNFDDIFQTLDSRRRSLNHCGAGKSLLQLDTEGRFHPCVWWANDAKEEVGRDATLDEAALAKFASSLIELNNCSSCWARHICGGGCMFVNRLRTGNKHSKDTEFCNRVRTIISKGIEYYEQSR